MTPRRWPPLGDENEEALEAVRRAREQLSNRVARRMAKGVLGANEKH